MSLASGESRVNNFMVKKKQTNIRVLHKVLYCKNNKIWDFFDITITEKQIAFQNCDMLNFNPGIDVMLWWLAFFILPMSEIFRNFNYKPNCWMLYSLSMHKICFSSLIIPSKKGRICRLYILNTNWANWFYRLNVLPTI